MYNPEKGWEVKELSFWRRVGFLARSLFKRGDSLYTLNRSEFVKHIRQLDPEDRKAPAVSQLAKKLNVTIRETILSQKKAIASLTNSDPPKTPSVTKSLPAPPKASSVPNASITSTKLPPLPKALSSSYPRPPLPKSLPPPPKPLTSASVPARLSSPTIPGVRGIPNLGQSCWMNASLQVLSRSAIFRKKLEEKVASTWEDPNPSNAIKLSHSLNNFFISYDDPSSTPEEMKEAAREVRDSLFVLAPNSFVGRDLTGQQCASTAIGVFLKILDFTHPVSGFPLALLEEGDSLEEALSTYLSANPLSHGPDLLSFHMQKIPQIGGNFSSLQQATSERDWIPPQQIDLAPFMEGIESNQRALYRLLGVANHLGSSHQSGHWIAQLPIQGNYVHISDASVTLSRDLNGLNSILVYERVV